MKYVGFLFTYLILCLAQTMTAQVSVTTNQNDLSIQINGEQVHIKSITDWEEYRWQILQNAQEVMGALPDQLDLPPMEVEILERTEHEGFSRTRFRFNASAKDTVYANLYRPHRSPLAGKLPAIVALHPTGAEGKQIVDGSVKPNRGYARELAMRGYIVLAPDYPGFGELSDYDFSSLYFESGTMAGIFYHMRCIDLLCQRGDVDPDRIGVIGHSLGGHNAIFLAAFDARVKVAVSSCGWTLFSHYDIGPENAVRYGGRLGPWAQDKYMPSIRSKFDLDDEKIPFDFHELIALIAPRAFFSSSPTNDANFDVNGVKIGMASAEGVFSFLGAEEKVRVIYPDAGHDFPLDVREEAYRFIDVQLGHIPRSVKLRAKYE